MDVEAIERDLARIPAVSSVRVIVEGDQVQEVHIVCGIGRSPKLINRDVQSLLAARWGVDVDHRKVSVVQLPDEIDLTTEPAGDEPPAVADSPELTGSSELAGSPEPADTPELAETPELALPGSTGAHVLEMSVSVSDKLCEVTVALGHGEQRVTGLATGVPSLDGQRRAVAGATLVALANIDPGLVSYGVSDAITVHLGGELVVVTTISGWRDGAQRTVVGAARVGNLGELRAVAESVLRAF